MTDDEYRYLTTERPVPESIPEVDLPVFVQPIRGDLVWTLLMTDEDREFLRALLIDPS